MKILLRPIFVIYCTGRAAAAISGDIVDVCDYGASPPQTRCGDTCVDYNRNCICGGERLFTRDGPNHCCVVSSLVNYKQCHRMWWNGVGEVNCPQGTVLNKSETCNGHCYNDYSASAKIGLDSQFRCGNHCVPVWKMCRGYSQCEDRSDVAACDETLTCVWKRGHTDRRQLESGLSDQHFYCNYEQVRNNGEYDTITRVDETDLDIRRQKVRIDYSSLRQCLYDGDPGLTCGEKCWGNYEWCLADITHSCVVPGGQISTNTRALCGNTTFWVNQTCDKFYGDGDKAALGLRCSGGAQHCIYPWYLSGNYYYEVSDQPVN